MKVIWKFEIKIEDRQEIEMPVPAETLCFQMQGKTPTLWCMVDPEFEIGKKKFRLAGTGHPIDTDLDVLKYIDTVQIMSGALIYHLFEILD